MRFRSKSPGRGQLLARDQRRITLLIAGVGIIAVLFVSSGRLSRLLPTDGPTEAAAKRLPVVSESLLGESELLPDEVRIVRNDTTTSPGDYAKMIDRTAAAAMENPPVSEPAGTWDVPQKLTRTIRDDVIGVQSSESAAWFGTLRLAERISPRLTPAAPEGQYALFMDSPQSCRGKPFLVRGRLRRLIRAPLPADSETFGVKSVYDAWISTRDSGNQLVHVVAQSADPGLPLTMHTGKNPPDVELVGYFFKREGYQSKGKDGIGDLELAPLVLAGKIHYLVPHAVVSRAEEMYPWLTWIGIGICGAVLILVWQFQMSDSIFRGTRTHQLTSLPVRPSFEGVEAETVQQALQKMESGAVSL